jgi:hypothetical protein
MQGGLFWVPLGLFDLLVSCGQISRERGGIEGQSEKGKFKALGTLLGTHDVDSKNDGR